MKPASLRRLKRNASLAVLTGGGLIAAYALAAADRRVERLSITSAYVALGLLAATLTIGPLSLLRGSSNPVSTHLRRDFGIWTAVLSTVHTVLGLQVHMGGNLSRYFVPSWPGGQIALDATAAFVATNYLGLIAILLLLVLLAISNDYALGRLGSRRWKSVQRWSYAIVVLVVAHGVVYQLLEGRGFPLVLLFGAMAATIVVAQFAGMARRLMDKGKA